MNLLPPWYYATRMLGAALILAGILDNSTDRGTLIITGAGLLGLDKVASSGGAK